MLNFWKGVVTPLSSNVHTYCYIKRAKAILKRPIIYKFIYSSADKLLWNGGIMIGIFSFSNCMNTNIFFRISKKKILSRCKFCKMIYWFIEIGLFSWFIEIWIIFEIFQGNVKQCECSSYSKFCTCTIHVIILGQPDFNHWKWPWFP